MHDASPTPSPCCPQVHPLEPQRLFIKRYNRRIWTTTIELFFKLSRYSWALRERERELWKLSLFMLLECARPDTAAIFSLSTSKVPTSAYAPPPPMTGGPCCHLPGPVETSLPPSRSLVQESCRGTAAKPNRNVWGFSCYVLFYEVFAWAHTHVWHK